MANLRKWNKLTTDKINPGEKLVVGYLVSSNANSIVQSNPEPEVKQPPVEEKKTEEKKETVIEEVKEEPKSEEVPAEAPKEEEKAGVGLGATGQFHVSGTIFHGSKANSPIGITIDKIEFTNAG